MNRPQRVVVFGGANLDVIARAGSPVDAGSSTPGEIAVCDGGVARNVAENLARLGTRVALVAPFGDDADGQALLARCGAIGIDVSAAIASPWPSSRYLAVLDHDGELVAGINDMRAVDALEPDDVAPALAGLTAADLVVLDANLPVPVLTAIASAAERSGALVVAEPVSIAKAPRLLAGLHPRPWLITPNTAELAALADLAVGADIGVPLIWQRLGADGSVLSGTGPDGQAVHIHTPAPPVTVADVTGAGDALLAGFLHAWLGGADLASALAYGHDVAAVTVADRHTVRPDLSPALIERFRTTRGRP